MLDDGDEIAIIATLVIVKEEAAELPPPLWFLRLKPSHLILAWSAAKRRRSRTQEVRFAKTKTRHHFDGGFLLDLLHKSIFHFQKRMLENIRYAK